MAQEKKQSFMKGAAILTASTLIVKIVGLLFSVPLMNLVDPKSMGYFNAAYDIFSVFLMLSTAGLPIAVSRMVGTAYSRGRKKEADRVFSVAFWLFFIIGLAGCLVMFFGSEQIAALTGSPGARYAIMALAPTLFFVSIMSALRGYFQGRSNMTPTAVSQTIEAIGKVIIGIGLAVYILHVYENSDDWAVVGAIVGVSASSCLGTIYLSVYKMRQKRKDSREAWGDDDTSASKRELLISLVKFAVPITIGSCFLSFLDMIDASVMMNRLQAGGFSQVQADSMRGILGNARKFFDLPGAFVIPISTSLLPVLSGAIATHDQDSVDNISSVSLRVTLLISIPASVGMCLFSEPICALLLPGNAQTAASTAPLLAVLSLAIAFNSVMYTTNAILQSFGRATIPVVNMAIGGALKITLTYFLTAVPEINVMGSAISTVAAYFLMMILNFIALRRSLPNMGSVIKTALPMVLSTAVMGAASYALYYGLCIILPARAAVIPAILAAVAAYALCVVALKAVTYEDIILLPKGETLARLLRVKKKAAPKHMRK